MWSRNLSNYLISSLSNFTKTSDDLICMVPSVGIFYKFYLLPIMVFFEVRVLKTIVRHDRSFLNIVNSFSKVLKIIIII